MGARVNASSKETSGDRHGHAKLKKEFANNTLHENHGNENRENCQRGCDGGAGDFACPDEGRDDSGSFHLIVARDIFKHHDGIIDNDSNRKRQGP